MNNVSKRGKVVYARVYGLLQYRVQIHARAASFREDKDIAVRLFHQQRDVSYQGLVLVDVPKRHDRPPTARRNRWFWRGTVPQSRSSSLIEVLARVCASTIFTMTAQYSDGPGEPSGSGLPGIEPGTTTE